MVDIGPGEGTYSDLLRHQHRGYWFGVEAWGPYVTKFNLWNKYDRVIISDARHVDYATIHHGPDLVIAGDVLEHMAHEESREVLARLKAWSRNVIISVPLVHHDQDAWEGNWFEHHQDHWSHEQMMENLGEGVVDYREGKILGYYLWSREKAAGIEDVH